MNILITGTGKGIGLELAKLLSKEHKVVGVSRKNSSSITSENFSPLNLDLVEESAICKLKDFIREKFDVLDIIINNAGVLVNKKFNCLTPEDVKNMMDINFKIPFEIIQTLAPIMGINGHIVNIGSIAGVQGSSKFPGLSVYSAAKGALAILTECLAEELKAQHVHVNCLALGATQTEMFSSAFPGHKAPLNAKEMAQYIADFSLSGNQFFNGKIIPVSIATP